jgi:aldose 1-epimerase
MFAMTTHCWPVERPSRVFTLRNQRDMRVTVSEHGAALVSWWAPDRYGRMADVLLGYPEQQDYAGNAACLGAVVERARGADGGAPRLHAAHWRGALEDGGAGLRLRPAAKTGIEVRYALTDDGCLSIDLRAVAAAPALANLSSHACFNLNGGRADVGDHMLQIDADRYLEIEAEGRWRSAAVSGTPFDFRRPAAIGPRLRWPHAQIGLAGGFDHCYCLGAGSAAGLVRQVATIHDPGSGRRLQVSTSGAGLRFYSGNRLGGVAGRGPGLYARHAGFCLEAGIFSGQDDPCRGAGPVLRSGDVYRQTTIYRLSLEP